MAAAFGPSGLSPSSMSRTLEKVFDDAQFSGEINLSQRKLREYPKVANKYDLADTSAADLSRNRLTEIPSEVCDYHCMQELNCYHNVIRLLPEALVQLHALVHLNLSRNQLSVIPPFIAQLQALEVLHASNNKLVSLPEEIGRLKRLMDLDVSCNEISHLPHQIGDLESLRHLKLRRNLLVDLPVDISRLRLNKLDVAGNRISTIPMDFRKMDCIEELIIDNNPLTSPPAHMCWKGRTHIMKYLRAEAQKEDRKRGILPEVELRRNVRKIPSLPSSTSDEFKYIGSPVERRRPHAVDSGYNTTDSSDKSSRWSPSEATTGDLEDATALAVKVAESSKKEQDSPSLHKPHVPLPQHSPLHINGAHHSTPPGAHKRLSNHDSYATYNHHSHRSPGGGGGDPPNHRSPGGDLSNHKSPAGELLNHRPPATGDLNHRSPSVDTSSASPQLPRTAGCPDDVDEFTRVGSARGVAGRADEGDPSDVVTAELQRQKAEYEAKKRNAERLRREMEEEEREKDARRRAAIRVQEEQKAILTQKREDARKSDGGSSPSSSPSMSSYMEQAEPSSRRSSSSQSFREEKRVVYSNNNYRRSSSDGGVASQRDISPSPDIGTEDWRSNHSGGSSVDGQSTLPPDEEYRRRHEALISQQRHEAERIRLCLEQEKQRLLQLQQEDNATDEASRGRQLQKDMLYSYFNKRSGPGSIGSGDEDGNYSAGRDPQTHTYNSATISNRQRHALPVAVQRGLEEMSKDLNNMNPGFTFRRHMAHAHEELELADQLRETIEARLKVTLPDDLPAALKDGVVLCHLANNVRPHSVSSIHVPSPAVRKLSMAKCRRNVENFLEACRRIGVEQEQLCAPWAVLEEKGTAQLAVTVHALLVRCGLCAPKPAV